MMKIFMKNWEISHGNRDKNAKASKIDDFHKI